jgi:hypothetical protein
MSAQATAIITAAVIFLSPPSSSTPNAMNFLILCGPAIEFDLIKAGSF